MSTALTPRELEIAQLFASGWGVNRIAEHLKVTPACVHTYRFRLRQHGVDFSRGASRVAEWLAKYTPPPKFPGLTPRAIAIMKRFASGETPVQIAASTMAEKGKHRGQPVKPSTIVHTISRCASAIGLYQRVGLRLREGFKQWLEANGYLSK